MTFPIQAPPVHRPELVHPRAALALQGDGPLDDVRRWALLLYGANHNDPPAFCPPTYQEMRVSARRD